MPRAARAAEAVAETSRVRRFIIKGKEVLGAMALSGQIIKDAARIGKFVKRSGKGPKGAVLHLGALDRACRKSRQAAD
ncbi:hypothetical protein CS8_055680 [Cupriavidus sp. 8B]